MAVTTFVLFIAAGAGTVWCAHRAYMRISAWGRNMDEVDAVFRFAEDGEEGEAQGSRHVGVIRFDESAAEQAHRDAIHAR